MAKKGRPFLTVYTVVRTFDTVNQCGSSNSDTIGSWIRRGNAIRECSTEIMKCIVLDCYVREAVYNDENHPELRGMLDSVAPADVVKSFFEDNDPAIWQAKTSPWEANDHARAIAKALVEYIEDELGGQGFYYVYYEAYGPANYKFDILENDVEGTMDAWTCVTSGETDEPDEDFEIAFPEVFLSEKEAVKCAIDDLARYLKDKGAKPSSVKKTLEKAEKSLGRCGVFQYEVLSGAVRRWDIWHTPITLSGELPKMSLTRRKDAKVQRNG